MQMLLAAVLALVSVFYASVLVALWERVIAPGWEIAAAAALAIATGTWLTAGLGHLPATRTWLAWWCLIATLLAAAALMGALRGEWAVIIDLQQLAITGPERLNAPFGERLLKSAKFGSACVVALGPLMLVSLLGVPVGQSLRRAHAVRLQRGRSRRRRRLRKHRA
jgi:hypothetical protein